MDGDGLFLLPDSSVPGDVIPNAMILSSGAPLSSMLNSISIRKLKLISMTFLGIMGASRPGLSPWTGGHQRPILRVTGRGIYPLRF